MNYCRNMTNTMRFLNIISVIIAIQLINKVEGNVLDRFMDRQLDRQIGKLIMNRQILREIDTYMHMLKNSNY